VSGMGKSIALVDCARHMAVRLQLPTLYFSLEMSAEDVFTRFAAGLTGIPERALKTRDLSPSQMVRVGEAREQLHEAPLWIIDGGRSLTQIGNTVRKYEQQHGAIPVLAVDYVQLLRADRRHESRQIEVSTNMQRLKDVALTERRLALTAAQINRNPAGRTDKRPQLSDLRESGEIENSSDLVILIYRDDYYNKDSEAVGEAEFHVAKHRGGPTGTVTVAAQLDRTRFVSFAEDPVHVETMTACIRCYAPHAAPQGSRCAKCAA
jgi:replicative DNA helicase